MRAIITIKSPGKSEYTVKRKYTVFCEIAQIIDRVYRDIAKSDPAGKVVHVKTAD